MNVFKTANCESMDQEMSEKFDAPKFQSFLDMRDEIIIGEKPPSTIVNAPSLTITDEIINARLSKLNFKEIYNLYFGPKSTIGFH